MAVTTGYRETLDVADVARIFGISKRHTYALIRSGELRGIRLGRKVVVPEQVVLDMLAGRAARTDEAQVER